MTFPSWTLVTSSAPGYFAIPGTLCILTGVLTDPVAHGGSAKEGSCSRAEEGGIRSRSPGRRSDRCSPPGSTTHASTLSAFSLRREIFTLLSGGSRIHRSPTLDSLTLSLPSPYTRLVHYVSIYVWLHLGRDVREKTRARVQHVDAPYPSFDQLFSRGVDASRFSYASRGTNASFEMK